ncbi:MAG: crossover junction endodeoxyribonuclease RuvC [Proteobacteria bacterium]|jgi:crossover junction endodeoxyribonuclease RuvC|nr:crossover junction endodeoxyribonuclease RuvC [Pseudomonadota bacterium]
MIILGIDPALNQTGYAVIIKKSNGTIGFEQSGVVKNKITEEFPQKLLKIFNIIDQICKLYKPQYCGIEETFVNVNPTSSLKLGAARGVIITAVTQNEIPIFECSPNKIKKTITGAGKADKSQVEFMIKRLITGVPEKLSPDEYDALAIALTCLCFA